MRSIKELVFVSVFFLTSLVYGEKMSEAKVENCEIKVNKNKMDIECENKQHKFKYGILHKLPDVYDSTLFTYEENGITKVGIFYTETTGKAGACAINVQKDQPLYNCSETELDTKKGEILKVERNVKHKSTSFSIKNHKRKILVKDKALNRSN